MKNIMTKPLDSRVPVDKQKVLDMFSQLDTAAQVGILSSLSVMLATQGKTS